MEIYTYVTENTFDSYLYQLVENKQKFIGQIMTSKSPVRSAEDIDEHALSYAEIRALCTGNPHIIEKMGLDIEVSRLKLLKANHLSQRYALEDQILHQFPKEIRNLDQREEGYTFEIQRVEASTHPNKDGFCPMEIEGTVYAEKKAAGSAILDACRAMKNPDSVPLGKHRGFDMELYFDPLSREYKITLIGSLRHTATLGTDLHGSIQRLNNTLESLPTRLQNTQDHLVNIRRQVEVFGPSWTRIDQRTKSWTATAAMMTQHLPRYAARNGKLSIIKQPGTQIPGCCFMYAPPKTAVFVSDVLLQNKTMPICRC